MTLSRGFSTESGVTMAVVAESRYRSLAEPLPWALSPAEFCEEDEVLFISHVGAQMLTRLILPSSLLSGCSNNLARRPWRFLSIQLQEAPAEVRFSFNFHWSGRCAGSFCDFVKSWNRWPLGPFEITCWIIKLAMLHAWVMFGDSVVPVFRMGKSMYGFVAALMPPIL